LPLLKFQPSYFSTKTLNIILFSDSLTLHTRYDTISRKTQSEALLFCKCHQL